NFTFRILGYETYLNGQSLLVKYALNLKFIDQ
ncbi:unnamed protein product, partial [marine sediment metagenome]